VSRMDGIRPREKVGPRRIRTGAATSILQVMISPQVPPRTSKTYHVLVSVEVLREESRLPVLDVARTTSTLSTRTRSDVVRRGGHCEDVGKSMWRCPKD